MNRERLLVVVDMQNDFVYGPLGTKQAKAIVPKVVEKIKSYKRAHDDVWYTLDLHEPELYPATIEGIKQPIFHATYLSEGWQVIPEIAKIANVDGFDITKSTFGTLDWRRVIHQNIKEIEMVGISTGGSVLSNAIIIRTMFPELPITVDSSCCACINEETHKAALKVMDLCQINVI